MMFLLPSRQVTVGQFGDKFRKAREKKQLSLDDVSNVTKISARMLKAIEEEHFDQLPGGVFNKGFIRAYSKVVGLNDDDAIADYLACLRQTQIDALEVSQPEHPRAPQSRSTTPDRRRRVDPNLSAAKPQSPVEIEELPHLHLPRADDVRPRRKQFLPHPSSEIPWGILAVTAVIIVLVTILWIRYSRNAHPAVASATIGSSAPEKSSPEKSVTETSTPSAPAPPSNHAPVSSPSSSSNANPQPPATPPAKMSTATDASRKNADQTKDANSTTNARPPVTANPKSSDKSALPLTLVIRATETSWISISADGQIVNREMLIAPAHASVRAAHEIVARIGNAAGVTFVWNGQEIPSDGVEGEAKTFTFDSTGMHITPPNPTAPQNQ